MDTGNERIERFGDAKFGLFVHWGPYSVAGVEASWPMMLGPDLMVRFVAAMRMLGMDEIDMPASTITHGEYRALSARFDPVEFDADEWVDLARDAGQRYVVLTTKHHDGFCMFDTDTTDYSIAHSPFGRDVTRELSDACADGGVRFGAYFSCPDIEDTGYRDPARSLSDTFLGQPERVPEWAGFLDRMEAQVRELLTRYGDLFCMWWDLGFGSHFPAERFHELVHSLQPGCLVNDRMGGADADFTTPEQAVPRSIPRRSRSHEPPDLALLFSVLRMPEWESIIEQFAPAVIEAMRGPDDPSLPDVGDEQPWEACMTFGGAWAYNPALTRLKTGPDLIRDLVEVASRGGNLLMNVGPTPRGTIQPEFQGALRDVGRWLARNGDAIYGSTFGPVQMAAGVRTTAKAGRVFAHVLGAPDAGGVAFELDQSVSAARVLDTGAPVSVERTGSTVTLRIPTASLDPVVTTVELLSER